jgi:hypothetical protein
VARSLKSIVTIGMACRIWAAGVVSFLLVWVGAMRKTDLEVRQSLDYEWWTLHQRPLPRLAKTAAHAVVAAVMAAGLAGAAIDTALAGGDTPSRVLPSDAAPSGASSGIAAAPDVAGVQAPVARVQVGTVPLSALQRRDSLYPDAAAIDVAGAVDGGAARGDADGASSEEGAGAEEASSAGALGHAGGLGETDPAAGE